MCQSYPEFAVTGFMVSIVNDGVSQGDGGRGYQFSSQWAVRSCHVPGGVRFGSNMFFLFARYVTLLATHALPFGDQHQ